MVQETIAAPGTTTFALGTPSTGFVAFSTIPSITGGDTVDYLAIDASGTPWEVGTGTWTSGALARTTVLQNSSGGTTAVNFTGSTLVSNTLTAERYLAGSGGPITTDTVTAQTTNGSLTLKGNGSGGVTTNGVFSVASGTSGLTVTPGWYHGSGTWLNLDTTGPSGVGSGGAGSNAWLALASQPGLWVNDAGANDIIIKNASGALRFTNNGTSTGLSLISNVVTAPTFASSNATITGGTVDGTAIGSTTASTGKFTTLVNGGVAQSPYASSPLFGTGADGSVTISSGTTTLVRDMHYANLTLSGTGAISTNGFRIFVSGTADFSAAATGAILAIGAAGFAASGATAGAAANITGYGGTVPVMPLSSGAGGAGSTTTGTASAAAGSITVGLGGIGGQGGSGGVGGSAAGGAAGASGIIYNTLLLPTPDTCLTSISGLNEGVAGALFGSGGGGGGGYSTYSGGGGGGGGGAACIVQIYARFIQRGANTNTSIISAKGGAGGAGAAGIGGSAAGGGGGGGGGGGCIYIVNESLLGSTIANALDVSGGDGASGGNGLGAGKGGAGGTGGATGRVQIVTLNPTTAGTNANVANGGTVTGYTFGYSAASAAGTAGSTTSTTTGGGGGAGAPMKVGL